MNDLPKIAQRAGYTHHWWYKDVRGLNCALIVRHDGINNTKPVKWFYQYQPDKQGGWVEGVGTPSPLFGLNTLPEHDYPQTVYIFEGEKCTQAAHYLGLPAITSMYGANAAHKADWKSLKLFPHLKKFILVPDHDESGKKFMEVVASEIRKVIPEAFIYVCQLPCKNKGDDFVDWLKDHELCPIDWDGFNPICETYSIGMRKSFEVLVENDCVLADAVFRTLHKQEKPEFVELPDVLDEVLSPVDPFPMHTLPKSIQEWVEAISQHMQVPVDFVVIPMLVAVGSLIGRKRGLLLRQGTNWIEYANVWGMIVGKPSSMKSPAMKVALEPLFKFAEEASKLFLKEADEYAEKAHVIEMANGVVDGKIKTKMKEEINLSSKIRLEDYSNFKLENLPQKPKQKRYIVQDSTVEKLGELLKDNPQGLLLYRDELAGLLYGFEKAGRENDRQFYLEAWSGKESYNVDRIGRGSIYIDALCLSVIGSIQPGPLSRYIHSCLSGGVGDDGLIQRFQLVVWPDPLSGWDLVVKNDVSILGEALNKIFCCIDHLEFDTEGKPVILLFEEDAQTIFDEWQRDFENRLRKEFLPSHLEAHLAKFKKLVPALCLILEHMECASTRYMHAKSISSKTLKSVLQLVRYFESHALRLYGSVSNAVLKSAKDLLCKIQEGVIQEPFTARDVYYRHHWSGLSNREEVDEVLVYLVERGYLAQTLNVQTSGGRPTTRFWVHPQIYNQAKDLKSEGPKGPK